MSFELEVKQWADKTQEEMDVIWRKTALDMFTDIVLLTPADTGRARGNWQLSFGTPASGVIERLDKTGSAVTAEIASKLNQKVDPNRDILFVNNLPYIGVLEYGGFGDGPKTTGGFSKQAPRGMVRVTIMRFPHVVETEATKEGFK